VIPALNRDGDCLSDLVMPMFGSIAGAESVLLAFDEGLQDDGSRWPRRRTAPRRRCRARTIANPMAMILACGAVLHYAAEKGVEGAERASRAIYESVLESTSRGRPDPRPGRVGGGRTEFTDDVIGRVRTKLDVWSSLGTGGR